MSNEDNRIASTVSDNIRDFFNVGKIKKMFRVGSEIFNALSPFIEKQTPLNALKSAFLVGKVVVDDLEIWPDDYFENWEMPYTGDFSKMIRAALIGNPYNIIRTSEDSIVIHIVHLEGIKFGYVLNTRTDHVGAVYVEPDNTKKAKEILKRELWKLLKNDNIVLRKSKTSANKEEVVLLETDDAFLPLPSKRASEYSSYLKKCIDAGVSRSVLLYGPPGTGKSTMARTIINNLGMKSFRIRVEDIGCIDSSTIFEAISIFEPDAVIFDDFDRSTEQASLLETLEFFQRHVKLVIATVNNKNMLDEAILRPGRFDELVQIKLMDEDVVRKILGENLEEHFELVKEWPIAFIQEYVKRLRFMNPDEAEKSVRELAHRVQRLSKYDDNDDKVMTGALLSGNRTSNVRDVFGGRPKKKKKKVALYL